MSHASKATLPSKTSKKSLNEPSSFSSNSLKSDNSLAHNSKYAQSTKSSAMEIEPSKIFINSIKSEEDGLTRDKIFKIFGKYGNIELIDLFKNKKKQCAIVHYEAGSADIDLIVRKTDRRVYNDICVDDKGTWIRVYKGKNNTDARGLIAKIRKGKNDDNLSICSTQIFQDLIDTSEPKSEPKSKSKSKTKNKMKNCLDENPTRVTITLEARYVDFFREEEDNLYHSKKLEIDNFIKENNVNIVFGEGPNFGSITISGCKEVVYACRDYFEDLLVEIKNSCTEDNFVVGENFRAIFVVKGTNLDRLSEISRLLRTNLWIGKDFDENGYIEIVGKDMDACNRAKHEIKDIILNNLNPNTSCKNGQIDEELHRENAKLKSECLNQNLKIQELKQNLENRTKIDSKNEKEINSLKAKLDFSKASFF